VLVDQPALRQLAAQRVRPLVVAITATSRHSAPIATTFAATLAAPPSA